MLRNAGISFTGPPSQCSVPVSGDPYPTAELLSHALDASDTTAGIADEAAAGESIDVCCQYGKPTEEAHNREARERAGRYLAELIKEVGGLTPEDMTEAEAWLNP